MKRLIPFILLLFLTPALPAQTDTGTINRSYARALDLTEKQADSIRAYADLIDRNWSASHFPKGKVMALRLYGYYYENKADYVKAIDYYLQSLDEARKIDDSQGEISALTDLAAVYTQDMKQPQKARDFYLECVRINKRKGSAHTLIDTYTNLGAIYLKLGLYDSVLYFLNEGLRIGKPLEKEGKEDLSSLYNNFGNCYYYLKQYDKSLVYFRNNYNRHLKEPGLSGKTDLWLDALNISDSYSEENGFDSAAKYGQLSLDLANQLGSKSKQMDSYQVLAKFYQRKGDYRKAWEFQRKWYELDTALVNGDTYKTIAELEEKYEARQRENEKLLLQAEVSQQKFHLHIMLIMAASLLLVAIAAALAFITKRNINRKLQATNELVTRQNERLSELNYEKNSLISIVSHELSTPFASIGMWSQLLRSGAQNLTGEQHKALDRIDQATGYGEKLIRHILDVEKAQTNLHKLNLENLDLRVFVETVAEDFQPAATRKEIRLHLELPSRDLFFLSDKQLLGRMLENLLSNAIKYTEKGKNVWLSVSEDRDAVSIRVRDEGVGIEPEELPHLFSKYSKISSQPTNGEPSTGLGLAIVKRIVEELNGQISCESAPGRGSIFTVVLKK